MSQHNTEPFQPGQSAQLTKSFGQQELAIFSALTGDTNPLHMDKEFAAGTRFGGRIVHGGLPSALLGTVMGTLLPGPGTVLVFQELNFYAPLYLDEEVIAVVTVASVQAEKKLLNLDLKCLKNKDQVILAGRAVVLYP